MVRGRGWAAWTPAGRGIEAGSCREPRHSAFRPLPATDTRVTRVSLDRRHMPCCVLAAGFSLGDEARRGRVACGAAGACGDSVAGRRHGADGVVRSTQCPRESGAAPGRDTSLRENAKRRPREAPGGMAWTPSPPAAAWLVERFRVSAAELLAQVLAVNEREWHRLMLITFVELATEQVLRKGRVE